LRVCDECQRFFAAKDLRQKFCSRECSNIDERRGAKDRVARWRDRKRKEQQRQAKEAVKKKIIGRLSEFLKATENGELSPKHGDLLKALGEGNKLKGWGIVRKLQSKLEAGVSKEALWESLPKRTKQIFSVDQGGKRAW